MTTICGVFYIATEELTILDRLDSFSKLFDSFLVFTCRSTDKTPVIVRNYMRIHNIPGTLIEEKVKAWDIFDYTEKYVKDDYFMVLNEWDTIEGDKNKLISQLGDGVSRLGGEEVYSLIHRELDWSYRYACIFKTKRGYVWEHPFCDVGIEPKKIKDVTVTIKYIRTKKYYTDSIHEAISLQKRGEIEGAKKLFEKYCSSEGDIGYISSYYIAEFDVDKILEVIKKWPGRAEAIWKIIKGRESKQAFEILQKFILNRDEDMDFYNHEEFYYKVPYEAAIRFFYCDRKFSGKCILDKLLSSPNVTEAQKEEIKKQYGFFKDAKADENYIIVKENVKEMTQSIVNSLLEYEVVMEEERRIINKLLPKGGKVVLFDADEEYDICGNEDTTIIRKDCLVITDKEVYVKCGLVRFFQ